MLATAVSIEDTAWVLSVHDSIQVSTTGQDVQVARLRLSVFVNSQKWGFF